LHWLQVLLVTFTRLSRAFQANEPLPYRAAALGLLVSGSAVCAWWVAAGMEPWVAVVALIIFTFIAVALTRFVSEGGMLFIQAPFRPTDIISLFAGGKVLPPRSLTALVFVERIFIFDLRAFLLPSLLDAYKISDAEAIPRRPLLAVMSLGILLAIPVSYWSMLTTVYQGPHAARSMWFLYWSPWQVGTELAARLQNPRPPSLGAALLVGVGGVVALICGAMRRRYLWWPFHPIGFAMGPSWPMIQMWFSILLGWMAKSLIVRYTGGKGLLRARPFFLGMVLGEFLAAGLWMVIDTAMGRPGHRLFLT